MNNKHTSSKIGKLASQTLQSSSSSQIAKQLAASALSQTHTNRQTGAKMESTASRVLQSDKYIDTTKTLAATVLAQSNKQR
jgi:hypothetical protein